MLISTPQWPQSYTNITFHTPHYSAVASCPSTNSLPPNCLRHWDEPRKYGFLYCTATRCAFINTKMKQGRGRGQHFTSSYLNFEKIYLRCCLMPSYVGSRSSWLRNQPSSGMGGLGEETEVEVIWRKYFFFFCWWLTATSLSNVSWRAHLVFLILIFVSNLHTLYISKLYIRSVIICTKCNAIWQCSVN